MAGYDPLNTLKPVADGIWIVDGPAIRFYGVPFSTRATIVRLEGGGIWVHSPTRLTESLAAEVQALGEVRHLIAPNWIHYAYVAEWQSVFPDAEAWAAPGVAERAAKHGMPLRFDHDLGPSAEAPWEGQIDQIIAEGSEVHREAVFFHRASRTLILTDLIENFERANVAWYLWPFLRLAGNADPDGAMPRDMRATFRDRAALRRSVEVMIGWRPERIVLAHGRWYRDNAEAELRRAFRFVL